jgi:hypothetical protein
MDIFGKKKQSEEDFEEQPEIKKPLFGFRCSPNIHMAAKKLAKELHMDLCVISEHAIQLGLMDIAAAAKDPEEREILRVHLNKDHVLEHLVESVSAYDAEAAGYLRDGQSLLHQKERAVRDLVELWTRSNLDPRLLREIVLQELQRRTAIMRSQVAKND